MGGRGAGDASAGDMPSILAPSTEQEVAHAAEEQEGNSHGLVGREGTEKPKT